MENTSSLLLLLSNLTTLLVRSQFLMRKRQKLRQLALRAKRRCSRFLRMAIRLKNAKTKNRRKWTTIKLSTFWEKEVVHFDDYQFKNCFRVSRETFQFLIQKLFYLTRQESNFRSPISLPKRVAVALYALGSSAEYRTIGNLFGIGRTTVGEIVLEVCEAIYNTMARDFLKVYPLSQEKIEELLVGFDKLGFPQCLGAVDGCHIEVNVPKEEATDYFNFKGWHSVILFAAVDYRYRFTYINYGTPGRCNDSSIFEESALKRLHETDSVILSNTRTIEGMDISPFLIGDSAFRLSSYLMKPFPYNFDRSEGEKIFNYRLSKCRRVAENAFGHLKARFRKLGRGLEVNIDNVSTVIKACCVLHNLCNETNDDIRQSWIEDMRRTVRREQPASNSNQTSRSGTIVRNALMKHFSRADGTDVDGPGVDGPGVASSVSGIISHPDEDDVVLSPRDEDSDE